MHQGIDIIYEAAASLEELLGQPIDVQSNRGEYDAIIHIKGITFYCVGKKYAKNESYVALKEALYPIEHRKNKLLIADHLPQNKADFLKENRINYMDAAGNTFIDTNDLFLYIAGRKPKISLDRNQTRAFQEAGLKLLLLLLNQQECINRSYRELAAKTGISVGSISNIFRELEAEHFLVREGRKRMLKNKEELIDRWVVGYKDFLKPRVKRQQMRSLDGKLDVETLLESDLDFYFGGEYGGQLLTQHLKAKQFIIYSNEEIKKIAQTLKLVPDEDGNIELCYKFWSDAIELESPKAAPKLVIYADLVNTGNNRNIETAEIIRKNGL